MMIDPSRRKLKMVAIPFLVDMTWGVSHGVRKQMRANLFAIAHAGLFYLVRSYPAGRARASQSSYYLRSTCAVISNVQK
jgi:hypothetical protein